MRYFDGRYSSRPLLQLAGLLAMTTVFACGPALRGGSPSAEPAAGTDGPTRVESDTRALARDIPRLIQDADIPGLSMAVVRNGRVVWARAFGTVNDSAQTPLDTETIFEAASLSKPVFAYLVMRLVDRGEFDLDRPLSDLLPYPRLAHDDRYKRITARMVLSHGTGLPNWGGERLTLRFEPGSAYGYSGEAFVYLQKVLEHTTGRPLDAIARREVFRPLGMTRSGYVWQKRFEGHAAYGKDWLWRVAPPIRYTEANAAASLLTTATDYAKFVAAVLTGRGLAPSTWKAYLTPVRESSPGLSVGLGIRVEGEATRRVFYHSGNNGRRFTGYMTGDVARGLGLVYFTNASNGTSLVEALSSRVFGDDRPALNRADYDRSDDPRLVALRSVQRAAVERGSDAARERYLAIRADTASRPTLDRTLELATFLAGRHLAPLSIEVLRAAVTDAPDSATVHLALGEAYESSGDFPSAIAAYRRAETLGDDDGEAERLSRWAEERASARARAVHVPEKTLETYAGEYRERVVALRRGRLHYSGGGRPESPLMPMAEALFEVEGDPTIRVRFVGDGRRQAVKLVEMWRDGSAEESLRVR